MISASIRAACSGTFNSSRTPPNPALKELTTTRPRRGRSASPSVLIASSVLSSRRGNSAGSEKGSA